MPTIVHLAPRLLGGSSGGITGSAIAILVCVGVVPVLVLFWVCTWLLFFYGNGRNCCCMRRKKATEPEMLASPVYSAEALNEKVDYSLPQRPFTSHRTESGSSTERPRDSRGTLKKYHRESIKSQWSSNGTIPVVHEPKPFV